MFDYNKSTEEFTRKNPKYFIAMKDTPSAKCKTFICYKIFMIITFIFVYSILLN